MKPTTRNRNPTEPKTFSEYQRLGERPVRNRTITRCYVTPGAAIRADKLTRLIERWRKEALGQYVTGNEKNSLRRCAYELERLLKT